MNRVVFLALLIILVLEACRTEQSENVIVVNKLLSFSFEMPPSPQLSFIPIFIKQSDSVVYTATTFELKQLYDSKNYSQSISLNEFILKSFNQFMIFRDTSHLLDSFKIDSKIYTEYINNNFEHIANKYTTANDSGYRILSSCTDFEEESTISYIFFLNNFFTIHDDVDGETSYMTFRKCLNIPANSDLQSESKS